jgi:hypothetical protein
MRGASVIPGFVLGIGLGGFADGLPSRSRRPENTIVLENYATQSVMLTEVTAERR